MPYTNYPIYQPNYSMQQNLQSAQPTNDERIWVQGRNSADAYLVAPNGFVRLWDSLTNCFYEKRADATGRPYPIEVYEYKRIEAQRPPLTCESTNDYSEQIKSLEERIAQLEKGVKKEVKKNVSKSNADDNRVSEV